MSEKVSTASPEQNKTYVKSGEFIVYLIAVFFYTNMTGMVGQYRNAYLVNVLRLPSGDASLFNLLTGIIPYVLNFFIVMWMDGRRVGKSGKFRPLILLVALPGSILLMLSFWTPSFISETITMIYIVTVAVAWGIFTTLGNSVNMIANVMTPNLQERDKILSFRGISSAVGNSACLVIILAVAGILGNMHESNPAIRSDEGMQYIVTAALCSVVGIIAMLLGGKAVTERLVYSEKKKNPLIGFKDILSNKYTWTIIVSEFLKNFRGIANYMGPFLAAALLGSTSKFLLFGLPTGIGTAVGMLIINFLLKKFNAKQLYIASGIYSVIANTCAFGIGCIYFKNPSTVLQIVFIVFLFLIGLQFGASNLLPNMFQADVLEDMELKTGKRLDASLPFVLSIFTTVSGTIASVLSPYVLYGNENLVAYIQPTDAIPNPEQSVRTKIMMLFFYTVFHGLMMLLAGVPFLFYKLTGKTKDDMHAAVLERRKEIALRQGEDAYAETNDLATDTKAE